jgi:pyridoxamine 5'-phosphate oxidase
MAIADIRREYRLSGLRRRDLDPDPIKQFKHWFEQASGERKSGQVRKFLIRLYKTLLLVTGTEPTDLTAMTLATVDKEGRPSARVVLLKGLDERGFIFFTNYESRKGRELEANPNAALVFYWSDQERQVCVSGAVIRVTTSESEAYFRSRPRGSRIAAWVSRQGQPVKDRAELEERWAEYESKFHGMEVPLPTYWGGYVLSPIRIEFWQGRPNRLHDRFCYTRNETGWVICRLAP